MMEKTIIRIVQDYCSVSNISCLVNEYSLFIAPRLAKAIKTGALSIEEFKEILFKRQDFFYANVLDKSKFAERLFKKLNYELKFYSDYGIEPTLLAFKQKMEDGLHKAFPEKKEDAPKRVLAASIEKETFLEAEAGGGNCDILIPEIKSIIETKVWKGEEDYKAGIIELEEYLISKRYIQGYYIVFDYNKNGSDYLRTNNGIFSLKTDSGKEIQVIFIRMNPVCPSKKYTFEKKKGNYRK